MIVQINQNLQKVFSLFFVGLALAEHFVIVYIHDCSDKYEPTKGIDIVALRIGYVVV